MNAGETTLETIFEGVKQYIIPLFQRTYSWKRKHWETLWDDLMDLYETDDKRIHFMGAMVTMPVEMSPHGINKYLLIDGQQRLTTLFILLALIRDLAPALAEQTNELYVVNKWGKGVNRYKLLPSQTDQKVFARIIDQKEFEEASEIARAYHFFRKEMQRKRPDGQSLDLERLRAIILKNLMVVSIVLDNGENPYLIFESLNGKGEPLTQADLVRNYIFLRIPEDDQQEAYQELWRPMEVQLGGHLSDFFWRYLTKDGTYYRQNTIYDAVKNRLASLTAEGVVDELLDIRAYSDYYQRLVAPSHEPNPAIQRRLHRINRWEINTAYPFLLKIYDDYEHGRLSASDVCKILDAIESYVVRRFFCRVPTNALNRNFIALYGRLKKENMVASVVETLAGQNWPSDEDFLSSWRKFPIYSSGTAKCRHILESLEQAQNSNHEPVDVTHSRITIEHVMPQQLNETWESELGPEAATIHGQYLHTIGNLSLTGMNESMGNSPFAEKKKVFVESNFALNKYFSPCVTWDADSIVNRAVALGNLALNIWQRPDIIAPSSSGDDPTGSKPTHFVLLGKSYPASTWREILLTTCTALVERHGVQEFARMAAQIKGASRQYVSYSAEEMTTPIQIADTNLWIEANQSSKSVLGVIGQIIEACGHTANDFKAYW